ncbi:MAG: CHAT domain-containing protein [Myxococcota bacterium]|nr:CHAT domain-containing protein [Myxococcota bacterium]
MVAGLAGCAVISPFSSPSADSIRAQLASGRQALAQGQLADATRLFSEARKNAHRTHRPALEIDARIASAETERAMGNLAGARLELRAALELSEAARSGSHRLAGIEVGLGGIELAEGRAQEATALLQSGAERAREERDLALEATARMDLGTLFALQDQPEEALRNYQLSAKIAEAAGEPLGAAQALANAARVAGDEPGKARALLLRGTALARQLPATPDQANLLLNLAETEMRLGALPLQAEARPSSNARDLLHASLDVAQAVGDFRAASYALGLLGQLDEKDGQSERALANTRLAIQRATLANAPEAVFRWQAQAGRILSAQGEAKKASAAYQQAVHILESLRHRIPWSGALGGSSFRTEILPVYYSLIDLLLERAADASPGQTNDPDSEQALLRRARDIVEALRAAELRDYFQDDCVDALRDKLASLESISPSALILYPILLPDRLVVLVGLPSGRWEQYSAPVPRSRVENEAHALRRRLQERTNRRYLAHARTLYDWLLRPLSQHLESGQFDTLVFVPDGALLTIPMATLHDGDNFLIERFALALTPGMELTDPQPMDPQNLRALLAGVSQGSDGFSPLPNVVAEIEAIRALTPSEVLLNADFQRAALRRELSSEPFGLVHLATHAKFSGSAEGAFLLAWDGPIGIDELASDIELFRFRDAPLELLTLSACETAQGDDRAALGLSGIAVQSGARSALGTLWSVNDPAAASLIDEFYRAMLIRGESRAQALRGAQRELLAQRRYRHPVYWAPFILIGSWL